MSFGLPCLSKFNVKCRAGCFPMLTVGFAGQHTLSFPRFVTLPRAAGSFDPAQSGKHGTVW